MKYLVVSDIHGSSFYANNMSEKEGNWWFDIAKKEYFFPHDRNKIYQE